MMVANSDITYPDYASGSGLGGTASVLQKMLADFREHREKSIVLGWRRELQNRVIEVAREASRHGWDGYDAEPITDLARNTAHCLVGMLPNLRFLPDVVPTLDGEIAFEWDHAKNYFFTVVTNQGSLIYTGIFGVGREQCGEELLGVELPGTVANILRSYFFSKA